MAEDKTSLPSPGPQAPVSTGYRYYVLALLCVIYALNFLDRNVISILVDPIKNELKVSDTYMGSLSGFAFAVLYSVLGIPIARWADVGNRRNIVTLGLTIWSAMTALSGTAMNFWHLALARIGVGIGEAAGAPPSHSMISDYFPPEKRSQAMAVFQSSIYIGLALGYLLGGWINQFYGWRVAFVCAGLPGLILALLLYLTVREPIRGASDAASGPQPTRATLATVLGFIAQQKSYLFLVLGIGLIGFTNYSFSVWAPSFLRRVHHMNSGEIGTYLGLIKGFCGFVGTLLGGFVAGRIGAKNDRLKFILSAVATLLVCPVFIGFVATDDVRTGLALLGLGTLLIGFHLGPCFAMAQNLVRIEMRTLSSSLAFLCLTLVGLGLGPFVVGYFSDMFRAGFGDGSVRYALMLGSLGCVLGALSLLAAARFVTADIERCART